MFIALVKLVNYGPYNFMRRGDLAEFRMYSIALQNNLHSSTTDKIAKLCLRLFPYALFVTYKNYVTRVFSKFYRGGR
jgi:hypothetical protein